jgi:hypothetical protein
MPVAGQWSFGPTCYGKARLLKESNRVSDLLANDLAALCSQLLPRIDAAYLDCVSDDLALLLAAHGVSDVLTPFAQDWRFDLVEREDGLPRIDLPPAGQDDLLGQRTGWRPRWRPITRIGTDLPQWQRELGSGRPVLLIGDAFHLPWLPYQGHEHMDHGFVLVALHAAREDRGDTAAGDLTAHILDPYDNITEWGAARPLATRLPISDLSPAFSDGRWAVLVPVRPAEPTDPAAQIEANAAAILASAEQGLYQRFAECHQQSGLTGIQSMSLQTWLLARNRALHARWLTVLSPAVIAPSLADRFLTEVCGGWQRAMEMAYVALRRVRSGRAAPPAAFAAVSYAADAEVILARSLLSSAAGQTAARGRH